jgi:exonuclease SbcD
VKFLHTSDWHVGRTVRGRSRDPEHAAVLAEVLAHAREQQVDCLLVSGDVFDTSAPSAESERIVYDFFRELFGAGIPAVLIAGNHDHPKRFEALAPLLSGVHLHLIGDPKEPDAGGVFAVPSRDGREKAIVAALPWVTERSVVEFARLQDEAAAPLGQYAEQVAGALGRLATAFRPDAVNVLIAHLLVNDAQIGKGGGERELHLDFGIYGLNRQRLPVGAQYVGLGHVHKPQEIRRSPAAAYSGSLLQLDFGEIDQAKSVNLVEIHPALPAVMTRLPISGGRQLRDFGNIYRGVGINDLPAIAAEAGDAWLRVFVDVDVPLANLTYFVREHLPNAVHIERARPIGQPSLEDAAGGGMEGRSPIDLFKDFYASSGGRGFAASDATLKLFRELHDEAMHEPADV